MIFTNNFYFYIGLPQTRMHFSSCHWFCYVSDWLKRKKSISDRKGGDKEGRKLSGGLVRPGRPSGEVQQRNFREIGVGLLRGILRLAQLHWRPDGHQELDLSHGDRHEPPERRRRHAAVRHRGVFRLHRQHQPRCGKTSRHLNLKIRHGLSSSRSKSSFPFADHLLLREPHRQIRRRSLGDKEGLSVFLRGILCSLGWNQNGFVEGVPRRQSVFAPIGHVRYLRPDIRLHGRRRKEPPIDDKFFIPVFIFQINVD